MKQEIIDNNLQLTPEQAKKFAELEEITKTKLLGKKIKDIKKEFEQELLKNSAVIKLSNDDKGMIGKLVEFVLGVEAFDTCNQPDLDCGIEIKTFGVRFNDTKGKKRIEMKDYLSNTALNYDTIITENFYNSNFIHKLNKMFVVFYEFDDENKDNKDEFTIIGYNSFDFAKISDKSQAVIKDEWETIQKCVIDNHIDWLHTSNIQTPTGNIDRKYIRLNGNKSTKAHKRKFRFALKAKFCNKFVIDNGIYMNSKKELCNAQQAYQDWEKK